MPFRTAGISSLSKLEIDADKDWKGYSILNFVADLGDDQKIFLGADDDYSIRYDSADDTFYVRDEANATEVEIPKNVAMNIASHAGRHEPGGADVTDAYLEGESAGLREEHGEVFVDELASASGSSGTITFATAFGNKPNVKTSVSGDQPALINMSGGPQASTDDVDPVGTDGFDYRIYNNTGGARDIWMPWTAIGS